jgi:hypothetical protein
MSQSVTNGNLEADVDLCARPVDGRLTRAIPQAG